MQSVLKSLPTKFESLTFGFTRGGYSSRWRVLAGRSVVDESMLTGKSLPIFKEKGLVVSAGTINWVVSCPCALGLATPTAILVGISLGARQGLLIRGGNVLERLARVDVVALDKIGILTEGKPAVAAVASFINDESEILQIAAAVEKMASHPIAKAIVGKTESPNLDIPSTRGQLTEPGFGCLAEVDGSLVAVGALEWVHQRFQYQITETAFSDLEEYVIHLPSSGEKEKAS